MAALRHEIPTHLNVEDKAFYGLSVRQVMYLTSGCSLGYGLWNQAAYLSIEVRATCAAACALAALIFALVRPHGRGLEEWAFVVLRFAAVPRISVWRPRAPDRDPRRSADEAWADLAPRPSWREERR
ncbi:MAG TPA: PrgI family protein [Candidatus Saccharimonadales bacterium]|nr:PrgI family protein [Candidatus Saccharimonadales bacterium]